MVNRVLRSALLSFAACGLALAAHAQTPPATPPAPAATQAAPNPAVGTDPVVARVNEQEVRLSDLMRLVSQLPPQVQQMPLDMIYGALVDQLVNQKLISAAGYKDGLDKTDETKAELKQAEERIVQRAFITKSVQSRITPDKLDAAYKDYLKNNPPQDEVKASHILVENEAEAKDIIAQLGKGGDFAKLAKEKSKDTVAAQQGGDLGYFTKETMVEPFANAAFAMKPGEISKEPVKTQFGYHVIKVEDKRKAPQPTLDEMKPQLEKEMSKDIVTAVIDDLRKGAKVETFQVDGSPMPKEEPAPAAKPAEPTKK
ncbi:peptidylprolyl isomerase [Azospirillum sp. TSO22-1]|uniref:peptidylprolyl isomerase n=1 Tax=Azospirillum sp. TSO22-1 TaxID=716789 RepID=UPI000D60D66C|nr:peptidylprolyl isomerase [Azospirillum sp. TSO22-1]PWC56171.1 peptidylprolyl isomerase [Azospirillum sp. TSO22-1]